MNIYLNANEPHVDNSVIEFFLKRIEGTNNTLVIYNADLFIIAYIISKGFAIFYEKSGVAFFNIVVKKDCKKDIPLDCWVN